VSAKAQPRPFPNGKVVVVREYCCCRKSLGEVKGAVRVYRECLPASRQIAVPIHVIDIRRLAPLFKQYVSRSSKAADEWKPSKFLGAMSQGGLDRAEQVLHRDGHLLDVICRVYVAEFNFKESFRGNIDKSSGAAAGCNQDASFRILSTT